jgi:hypothetical protein
LHHVGTVHEAHSLIDEIRAAGYATVACRPQVKLTFLATELLDGSAPGADRAPTG